ncbi:MAG: type II secretion system GspH family protein, partial [bacterium]|nr:type II secretion system GspH family protein [bacterium]
MKKFGFTLPEILIALAVVGIVAALVIPSLVTDVNDQTNASRLSSSVNDLEIAFKQMMDEDEVDDIGRTTSGFFSPSASDMIDAISQHLKVLNIDTSVANFSSWYVDSGNFRFQTINGTNDTWSFAQPNPDGFTPHNVYFMLKNGAIVVMSGFIGRNLNETDLRCQRVMIDVNGKERPNMYGRD